MIRRNHVVAWTVAAILGSSGALATYTADAQTSSAGSGQLAEIVVTATKRKTLAQDTPISMTVFTAANIADRGVVDFNTLAQGIPGLSMRTSGPNETEYEMRGLNSSGGNTSMVGVYLGDIALSAPASEQLGKVIIDPNLYDLQRVEVLHGPQGTLYGSSSMGGTVRLIPASPELGVFDATGETTVSDTGSGGGINFTQNGMVNLPFGSTTALRLVGSHTTTSGWLNRYVLADGAVQTDTCPSTPCYRPSNFYTAPLLSTASGVNSSTDDSFRAILRYQPNDQLQITPMLMWQEDSANAPNAVDVNGSPTNPTMPAQKGHYEIYQASEPQWDRFTLGSLKIQYAVTPDIAITSITGLWSNHALVSQDGSEENASSAGLGSATQAFPYDPAAGGVGPTGPGPFGPGVEERDYTRQVSEEFRVASTGNAPLQWLVGYYSQSLQKIGLMALRQRPSSNATARLARQDSRTRSA